MSHLNPSLINEETPKSAPLSATPHLAAGPIPGKMRATVSLNPTAIPASSASLPNPATSWHCNEFDVSSASVLLYKHISFQYS